MYSKNTSRIKPILYYNIQGTNLNLSGINYIMTGKNIIDKNPEKEFYRNKVKHYKYYYQLLRRYIG